MKAKFVITDPLVADCFGAVSSCPEENYKHAVTGGMAIQLYARDFPNLERPTTDMDLLVVPRLTAKMFKEGPGAHLKRYLAEYNPTYGKTRISFEIGLTDSEGYPFFIHTYRQNGGYSFPSADCVRRQVSNANIVHHEKGNVHVVRPEDIIARKLRRLDAYDEHSRIPEDSRKRYSNASNAKWERLADEDLDSWLFELASTKATLPAFVDRGEEEFKARMAGYTISKDLFDISVLSKLAASGAVDFDERYYEDALERNEKR